MNRDEIYKGLGFVEALTAILVTGIASVALMDMAAKTMTETIRTEMTDTMTQYAIEGAEMAQVIADQERITGNNVFPEPELQLNTCFLLNEDVENPMFLKENEVFISYQYIEREEFKEIAKLEKDEEYFRVFCTTDEYSEKLLMGKVIVGLVERSASTEGSELVFSTGGISNISDYEYYTIIKR